MTLLVFRSLSSQNNDSYIYSPVFMRGQEDWVEIQVSLVCLCPIYHRKQSLWSNRLLYLRLEVKSHKVFSLQPQASGITWRRLNR